MKSVRKNRKHDGKERHIQSGKGRPRAESCDGHEPEIGPQARQDAFCGGTNGRWFVHVDPGHGPVVGRDRQPGQHQDHKRFQDRDRGRAPLPMRHHVRIAEQHERAQVQKLHGEHQSGEDGRDSGKKQEMSAVEFGGPVEDLAEGHRPELVVHIIPCAPAMRRLAKALADGCAREEAPALAPEFGCRKRLRERLHGS